MAKSAAAHVAACAGLLALASIALTSQDRGVVRVPAPVGPEGQIQELYAGSYALLVGVARYQNRVAWNSLDSIPAELGALQDALKAQGFQAVERVMNPTGAELRRAIDDFIGRYGFNPKNRLVFYFSGHGHTLDDGERGFFVPADAPDPAQDEPGFRRVALSMQQIATWAQEITVRHALFAFDSCFSGQIFRTRDRPVSQRLAATTAQPVRVFLSAGGAGERVPAKSIFAPVLVRALNGAADLDNDGFVTGTELGNFVQREVIEYRAGQTPQFGKIRDLRLDQGDIVFLPPRQGSAPNQPAAAPHPAAIADSSARSDTAASPGTATTATVAAPSAIASSAIAVEEPTNDSYVVGQTTLRAAVNATTSVVRVEFFVDGVRVCQTTRPPFECEWDAGAAARERVVRAVAVLPSGERLAATVRTRALPTVTDTARVDVVLVPFVVTDDRQRFVKGLERSEFRVTEDNVPQEVSFFQGEEIPLDVVIAVDISASMAPSMPQLKEALKRFVTGLKPTDRVTLIGFNHQVFVLAQRQADRTALTNAIDGLTAAGSTALFDAVAQSVELLGTDVHRRAVLVFSDGDDQASLATADAVERRVKSSDAVAYFVTLGNGGDRRVLTRLADLSGGRASAIGRIAELDAALSGIREEIENQYLIGYTSSNSARDGTYRQLGVVAAQPRLHVRARQWYRADRRP
jgi:VWFA-related protein